MEPGGRDPLEEVILHGPDVLRLGPRQSITPVACSGAATNWASWTLGPVRP